MTKEEHDPYDQEYWQGRLELLLYGGLTGHDRSTIKHKVIPAPQVADHISGWIDDFREFMANIQAIETRRVTNSFYQAGWRDAMAAFKVFIDGGQSADANIPIYLSMGYAMLVQLRDMVLGQFKKRSWYLHIKVKSPRYSRHRGPRSDFDYRRAPK